MDITILFSGSTLPAWMLLHKTGAKDYVLQRMMMISLESFLENWKKKNIYIYIFISSSLYVGIFKLTFSSSPKRMLNNNLFTHCILNIVKEEILTPLLRLACVCDGEENSELIKLFIWMTCKNSYFKLKVHIIKNTRKFVGKNKSFIYF